MALVAHEVEEKTQQHQRDECEFFKDECIENQIRMNRLT
jgi:hypothetical protein